MKYEQTYRQDRRMQYTCWCEAYRFPHRMGSGDCPYHLYKYNCLACGSDSDCEVEHPDAPMASTETLSAAQLNEGVPSYGQR
jgi:hypothetical protein